MKPVKKLFSSTPSLSLLARKMADQQALLKQIRRHLPVPLDTHCLGAILHHHTLILYTDSPAWASRIRYLGRQLQQQLQSEGVSVSSIQTKVINPSTMQKAGRKRHAALALSPESAEILRSTAEFMEDPALKAALLRLSRHIQI